MEIAGVHGWAVALALALAATDSATKDSAALDCAALDPLVWRSVRTSSVAPTWRSAKGRGFFLGEAAQFTGALLDLGGGNVIGHLRGGGAGADGVRENVEVGERIAVDEVDRGGVVVGGFAGETGDDVGADGGVGELIADEFDPACVVLGAIPPMHRGENSVGPGLQRHVEMLRDARRRCEQRDEILRHVERLDGTDAEARDFRLVKIRRVRSSNSTRGERSRPQVPRLMPLSTISLQPAALRR